MKIFTYVIKKIQRDKGSPEERIAILSPDQVLELGLHTASSQDNHCGEVRCNGCFTGNCCSLVKDRYAKLKLNSIFVAYQVSGRNQWLLECQLLMPVGEIQQDIQNYLFLIRVLSFL